MDYQALLQSLTPAVYQSLKRAVELGKWPDGRAISGEQREHCMQAVIAYEHQNLPPEQHTGYIPPKPGGACGDDDDHDHAQEQPLNWQA